MGTTADKLRGALNSKADIKAAIIEKGVDVGDDIALAEYGNKIREISGGGPAPLPGQHRVRFILPRPNEYGEYVWKTVYVDNGGTVDLPQAPDMSSFGLTSAGFTHTASELQNILHDIDVGLYYRPTDNSHHLFIDLTPITGLYVNFELLNSYFTSDKWYFIVDWGDGTEDAYIAPGTQYFSPTHTYSEYGKYEIIIKSSLGGSSGFSFFGFGRGGTAYGFFGGSSNPALGKALKGIYIGMYNNSLPGGCLAFSGLEFICTPGNITLSGFKSCFFLRALIIPKIATLNSELCRDCNSLEYVVIPNTVTSLGNHCFYNSSAVKDIVISGVIGSSAFTYDKSLQRAILKENVSSIAATAFNGCSAVGYYIILSSTPPSLAAINAFTGISPTCKIYVPDESVDAYKAATNWTTYADYIYPLSEKP